MYQIFLIKVKVALTQNNFFANSDKLLESHFNHLQNNWHNSLE